VRLSAGKLGEAEQLHRQAVEAMQRTLGPEHPGTLASLHNLASTLQDQGKRALAHSKLGVAGRAAQRVGGWPTAACVLQTCACAIGAGKRGEAEQLFRQALEAMQRTLGPEHPHTLGSLGNLGITMETQGKRLMHTRGAQQLGGLGSL
jgi:hypothetical protein